jgi:hypothetical protein
MFGRAKLLWPYLCVPVKELGVASFRLTKHVVCFFFFFMKLSDRMSQEGECKFAPFRAMNSYSRSKN